MSGLANIVAGNFRERQYFGNISGMKGFWDPLHQFYIMCHGSTYAFRSRGSAWSPHHFIGRPGIIAVKERDPRGLYVLFDDSSDL